MNPYYKSSPKTGYMKTNFPSHSVQHGLQSPESITSPYQYQPVYYDNQPQPPLYQVQYKFIPYQQQQQQQQLQLQHQQNYQLFQTQQLQHPNQHHQGHYLQLPPLGNLQASPIIHRSQAPLTPSHSHSNSAAASYTTELPQLRTMSSSYRLPYQRVSGNYLPPDLQAAARIPMQGQAHLVGGSQPQPLLKVQALALDHDQPKNATKRHKKSKSYPESRYYDSLMRRKSTSGSSGSAPSSSHTSTSNTTRKSHYAEAPASEDVKFPICSMGTLSLESLAPQDQAKLKHIFGNIEVKKYSTSAIDPLRNYLTVYEYALNKHWVIWDYETGFVHLTGIWKASISEGGDSLSSSSGIGSDHPKSHFKADIVKLLETTPKEYQQHIKRIRGGFLKIQGTWLPYDLCKIVARKFCYHIRFELIPIFGEDFPESCLNPDDPGFGKLRLDESFEIKDKRKRSSSQLGQEKSKLSVKEGAKSPTQNVSKPTVGTFTSMDVSPKSEAPPYTPNRYTLTSRPALRELTTEQTSISGPNSSDSLNNVFSSNTSYTEMLDIVTASKCLQSLRSGCHPSEQPVSYTMEPARSIKDKETIQLPDIRTGTSSGTGSTSSLTSPLSTTATTSPPTFVLGGGISTILKAANLREDDGEEEREQIQDQVKRRISLKIHDLIS